MTDQDHLIELLRHWLEFGHETISVQWWAEHKPPDERATMGGAEFHGLMERTRKAVDDE